MTAQQALFSIVVGVAISLVTMVGSHWFSERSSENDRQERERGRVREDRIRALTSFIEAFSAFNAGALAFRAGKRDRLHDSYAQVEAARHVLALYFPQRVLTEAINVAGSCLAEPHERGTGDLGESFEEDVFRFLDVAQEFLGNEYPALKLARSQSQ